MSKLYIHQIWLQGKDELPPNYVKYSKKYKDINNNYTYKLWSENDIRELVKTKYPEILSIYDGYEFWVMKVDLGKYCMLDSYPGFLVDMDTEPLLPFKDLEKFANGRFMIIEYPHARSASFPFGNAKKPHFHFAEGILDRVTNNNFLFSPYKHHPFMQHVLKTIPCTAERLFFEPKFYYILGSVGPLFLIDCIESWKGGKGKKDLAWLNCTEAKKYFKDEQANSWNKRFLDDHDSKSILFLLFLLGCIIVVLVGTWRIHN